MKRPKPPGRPIHVTAAELKRRRATVKKQAARGDSLARYVDRIATALDVKFEK